MQQRPGPVSCLYDGKLSVFQLYVNWAYFAFSRFPVKLDLNWMEWRCSLYFAVSDRSNFSSFRWLYYTCEFTIPGGTVLVWHDSFPDFSVGQYANDLSRISPREIIRTCIHVLNELELTSARFRSSLLRRNCVSHDVACVAFLLIEVWGLQKGGASSCSSLSVPVRHGSRSLV